MKKSLVIAVVALLLLAIVAVPVFGVNFYSSPKAYSENPDGYYVTPSIFDDNALSTNRQFGGGTTVYLSLNSGSEKNDALLSKTCEILKARFHAMGYTDTEASVTDGKIRLDISQKTYIDSVISQFGAIGAWSITGSDMSEILCDSTMISDAEPVANNQGSYSIRITFTEDGAKKFSNNTASYVFSSSYMYFMIDGQLVNFATVTSSDIKETFTFGTFDASSAVMYAAFMKEGAIPGTLTVESTEELAPSFSPAVITACIIASCVIIAALAIVLLIKGRAYGLLGAAILAADVAILATFNMNGSFILNLVSLIGILVMLVASAAISFYSLTPFKNAICDKRKLGSAEINVLSKISLKVVLIHLAMLTLAIIGRFFATGSLLYVAQALLPFTVANFVLYFVFLYVPVLLINAEE